MDEDLTKLLDALDERRVNMAIEKLESEIEEFAAGRRANIKMLRLLLRGAQALNGVGIRASSASSDRGGVSTSSRPGDIVKKFLEHAGPSRPDAIARGTGIDLTRVQKVLSSGKDYGTYKQSGETFAVA